MPEFDPDIAAEFATDSSVLTFLGTPVFETLSLYSLLLRFAFNLVVALVIVRCFYFSKSRRRDYLATFILFSATMFLLIFCMQNVKLQIGFTLGLFAIFGMIRYRTETVPVREMTYLFVMIGVSVINGLAMDMSYSELLVANLLLIALIWIFDGRKIKDATSVKTVMYDKIELIVPSRRDELVADLEKRLGVKVVAVETGGVDFLKDSCVLKVTYILPEGCPSCSADGMLKAK